MSLTLIVPQVPLGQANSAALNGWSPYGPRMKNLLIKVYGDTVGESNAFGTMNPSDGLDVIDSPISPGTVSSICGSSSYLCPPAAGSLDLFGLDFNFASASSGHTTFFGCDFSDKTVQSCGTNIRQGVAHLIDKQAFINNVQSGYGDVADCFAAKVQNLPCSQSVANGLVQPWTTNNWDLLSGNTVSAFHMGGDSVDINGAVLPGSPDFCAAAKDFLAARVGTGMDSKCILQGTKGLGMVNLVIARDVHPLLKLGFALEAAINSLMGYQVYVPSPFVNKCIDFFGVIQDLVTSGALGTVGDLMSPIPSPSTIEHRVDPSGSGYLLCDNGKISASDWHMMTNGWPLTYFPEQFYFFFNSKFSSSANYNNPDLDRYTSMIEFNSTFGQTDRDAKLSAESAEYLVGRSVAALPIYSGYDQFAYLNGWNRGIINQIGTGTANKWTALNAFRADPAVADTIRWGNIEGTNRLSPFFATRVWELFFLDLVYDSMLQANPRNQLQVFDWMTFDHYFSYSPSSDITTMTWKLRSDIYWQNGAVVSADDVVFTTLSYRDIPSATFEANVANVINATVTDSRTVRINLKGQSPFFERNIGYLPIIPHSIWGPYCNWPVGASEPSISVLRMSNCANPSFDPMQSGIVIGSGPWVCRNINTNAIGGSCTTDSSGAIAGQSVLAGGAMLLRRYDLQVNQNGHMRCCPGLANTWLHMFSWADKDDDGVVGINELAEVASYYGKDHPYWNTGYPGSVRTYNGFSLPSLGSNATAVDINEVAMVSFYFDYSLVPSYFTDIEYSSTTGIPCMDPFFQPGCG